MYDFGDDKFSEDDILQIQSSVFQNILLTSMVKDKGNNQGLTFEDLLKLLPPDAYQPQIARRVFLGVRALQFEVGFEAVEDQNLTCLTLNFCHPPTLQLLARRTSFATSQGLTLGSPEPEIWQNTTGLSTQLVFDITFLLCLARVAQQAAGGELLQSDCNDGDVKMMVGASAKMSFRLRLAMRSSPNLKQGGPTRSCFTFFGHVQLLAAVEF